MSHLERAVKKARKSSCTYRVVAIGLNKKGDLVSIKSNRHGMDREKGSVHAEEHIMKRYPSVRTILIIRVGKKGTSLPIDACSKCKKMADKKGVKIMRAEDFIDKRYVERAFR